MQSVPGAQSHTQMTGGYQQLSSGLAHTLLFQSMQGAAHQQHNWQPELHECRCAA